MKKMTTIKIGGTKINVKDMTPSLRNKIEEQLGEKIEEQLEEKIEDDNNKDTESHIGNEENGKKDYIKTKKEDTSLFRKMFGFRRRKIRKKI